MTFEATLDTSFPDGTTTLPNAVVVVGTGSNCMPEANQDADCNTSTTVGGHPNIHAEKTVDGEHVTTANPGDVLHYAITVTNSGTANGTADISDDVNAILAHASIANISDGGTLTAGVITWPTFSLAALTGTKTVTFEATLDTSFPERHHDPSERGRRGRHRLQLRAAGQRGRGLQHDHHGRGCTEHPRREDGRRRARHDRQPR